MSHANSARESADGVRDTVFNIILLGNSGAGKSASANTILDAGKQKHKSRQCFPSHPSSTPVTTKCEGIMVELFGTEVRVVDTPDFFYEDKPVDQAQVDECKKYCQSKQHVMLLVIQLGRFTDGERGILEKLETKLGWQIRRNTIILFTHGEGLTFPVDTFVQEQTDLKKTVEACGGRYFVFANASKASKQVKALTEKFPHMFPNFTTKKSSAPFCCGNCG